MTKRIEIKTQANKEYSKDHASKAIEDRTPSRKFHGVKEKYWGE